MGDGFGDVAFWVKAVSLGVCVEGWRSKPMRSGEEIGGRYWASIYALVNSFTLSLNSSKSAAVGATKPFGCLDEAWRRKSARRICAGMILNCGRERERVALRVKRAGIEDIFGGIVESGFGRRVGGECWIVVMLGSASVGWCGGLRTLGMRRCTDRPGKMEGEARGKEGAG